MSQEELDVSEGVRPLRPDELEDALRVFRGEKTSHEMLESIQKALERVFKLLFQLARDVEELKQRVPVPAARFYSSPSGTTTTNWGPYYPQPGETTSGTW